MTRATSSFGAVAHAMRKSLDDQAHRKTARHGGARAGADIEPDRREIEVSQSVEDALSFEEVPRSRER